MDEKGGKTQDLVVDTREKTNSAQATKTGRRRPAILWNLPPGESGRRQTTNFKNPFSFGAGFGKL